MVHLMDLRDTIQALIDLPDFEVNRKDGDISVDESMTRDKAS